MLDENVRIELFHFLKRENYDVKLTPKGTTDIDVALLSKKEKRILVTNDSDFTNLELYTSYDLFAVIWLRISQSESDQLPVSLQKLLKEYKKEFAGKLFILLRDSWEVHDLGTHFDFSAIDIKKRYN